MQGVAATNFLGTGRFFNKMNISVKYVSDAESSLTIVKLVRAWEVVESVRRYGPIGNSRDQYVQNDAEMMELQESLER